MTAPIRFEDGAAYERYMGVWSQFAGEAFLRWLAPAPRLRWLDVGCGNGAFTEMLMARCAPASMQGIDPSAAQLAFAQSRPALRAAEFRQGDAMALPYPAHSVDAAVMPLVIFFLSDPGKGVAEMARVVAPGGVVTAYAWDMPDGGFPYAPLFQEMNAMGLVVPSAPSPDASRLAALEQLWRSAGLVEIETTVIWVERTFANLADYWSTVLGAASVGALLRSLSPTDADKLLARLEAVLPANDAGQIRCQARANAVRGRVAPKS